VQPSTLKLTLEVIPFLSLAGVVSPISAHAMKTIFAALSALLFATTACAAPSIKVSISGPTGPSPCFRHCPQGYIQEGIANGILECSYVRLRQSSIRMLTTTSRLARSRALALQHRTHAPTTRYDQKKKNQTSTHNLSFSSVVSSVPPKASPRAVRRRPVPDPARSKSERLHEDTLFYWSVGCWCLCYSFLLT
jgi:hypothetical protein